MYCHTVYISTWALLHFGETCSFTLVINVIALPNQKSNKKVKNFKKWQTKSTPPIVFSFSSGSLVHFSRKRSPVLFFFFLTKTRIPVLIQKPKEKRERERRRRERERERPRER